MNERFVVLALSSPPNRGFLQKIMDSEFGVKDFNPLSLEFPILMEENYGFIDLVGNDIKERNTFGFVTVKWGPRESNSFKKEVNHESKECQFYFERNGFYPSDVCRIYSDSLFEYINCSFNGKLRTNFYPLVINAEFIENIIGFGIDELVKRYADFRCKKISNKVPKLKDGIKSIVDNRLAPITLAMRKGKKPSTSNLEVICFNTDGEKKKFNLDVDAEVADNCIPGYYPQEENIRDIYKELSDGKMMIHFYPSGIFKPNYFLEMDEDRFICLQHVGKGTMQYKGLYDKNTVNDYGKNSILPSTVKVDSGSYNSIKQGSKLLISFHGDKYDAKLRMKIEKNISFSGNFSKCGLGQQEMLDRFTQCH